MSMGQINNWDTHIQLGPKATTTTQTVAVAPVGGSGFYTLDQVVVIPGQPFVWARNPDGSTGALLYSNGYGIWTTTATTTADTAINADPALISSGGDMTLVGAVYNRDSRIIAGGTLTASNVTNEALKGNYQTTSFSTVVNDKGQLQPIVLGPMASGTVDVGAFEYVQHVNATSGYNAGTAATGSASANGGGATGAGGGTRVGTIVEVAANVGGVAGAAGTGAAGATGTGAGAAGGASDGSGQTIPMVVRTSTPNLGIPTTSLFSIHGGPGGYLIETDPRFANYRNWLSSDYLLNSLGLDPNNTLKRLGDGFYEQKLIREQVAQLTGYRYLDGYANDEDQYIALMNAGVTFAKEYGLRPGIALTAAQMAQLTSDIVWLVEQTVTLPDGSTQRVLVPQVYVRVRPGDIDGSGALLAGNQVRIDGKDNNLVNTGTIAGRQLVSINANTIDNLGGRISGGQVGLKAQVDINNLGGTIDARDKLTLDAGRDINVRTTTASGAFGNQNVDRVAGLYVTNPGGTLVASAGHDVNLVGAVITNQGGGLTSIKAGNDINLGTVTTSSTSWAIGDKVNGHSTTTKELGTTITTNGTTLFDAGQDINIRQGTVDAGQGALGLRAGRDINVEPGRTQTSIDYTVNWTDKGVLTRTTNQVNVHASSDHSVASRLTGNTVDLDAKRDVTVIGSDIIAPGDITLKAGRNANIVSSVDTDQADAQHDRKRTMSALGGLVNLGVAAAFSGASMPGVDGKGNASIASTNQYSGATSTERASNITSTGGNVSVTGKEQVNIYASNLSAAGDLNVTGGDVTVMSGQNQSSFGIGDQTRTRSMAPNQVPHSLASGLNTRNNVTSRLDQTSLAPATLSGQHVNITATTGDLNLIAPTINAGQSVTLSAVNGDLNFGVVNTGTEVSQTRGQRSVMYQRGADSGTHVETANYTQINSPNLSVDARHINVQVGQNATPVLDANGQPSLYVPQQTLQQALQQVIGSNQPGTEWIRQLQNDRSLDGKINWEGVPVAQRQWAESQGSLTQTGAAVVTIVASVLTWGYGAEFVGVAGNTAVGAAANAGFSALASHAAVSLINNNGDIGATLRELGSSRTIKDILVAMATAGAVQGLNIGLGIQGWTASGAAAGTATWPQVLARNLLNGATAGIVGAAINGTSVEEAIKNGLLNGLLNTAASGSAQWIGGNQEGFANAVAHAIAGCLVGAARAGAGYGMSEGDGCSAGAIGATVGHLAGQFYNPTNDPSLTAQTIQFGQFIAGIAGALIGGDQASADIASAAGGNAVEYNQMGPRGPLQPGFGYEYSADTDYPFGPTAEFKARFFGSEAERLVWFRTQEIMAGTATTREWLSFNDPKVELPRSGGPLYEIFDLGLSDAGAVRIAYSPKFPNTFYVSLDHYAATTAQPLRWTRFDAGPPKR
ncbi:DUF637 domain-containing protein [Variovorax sp. Root318D1]|uniref:DUF637 domain-containing protein n=1 Tax=Variovorax sp. Root318D1 TaxID=1736513 RepID=UPI001F3F3721|nr:DUF637 domain-containing protein [Variovorax sp. Root318D1]